MAMHQCHGEAESGYNVYRPVNVSYNSKVHLTKTERIVEFRQFPNMADHHNYRKELLYQDHGAGDKPLLMPWGSTHDRLETIDEFSPKSFHEAVVHTGSGKDGAWPSYQIEEGYNDHNETYKRNDNVPIKTSSEWGRGLELLNENPKNSPVSFVAQQPARKSDQEIIDSAEARRRYGGSRATPRPGAYAEEKYTGVVIDSKEAARKYGGVLF